MFYGFFYATLPTLNCGVPAEISLEEFDRMVRSEMSEKNFSRLCSWDDRENTPKVEIYRKMRDFDRFLKLRIAEKRQEKLGTSFVLPPVDEFHSEVDFALPGAAASDDPLERERMIDLIRWRKIDDLEAGHELDFIALCCYRMRLASLEKYRKRSSGEGNSIFETAVDKLSGAISNI